MDVLFIINEAPYGNERFYNALRLAQAMLKQADGGKVVLFLMADAVTGARKGQKTPEGYYNIELMLSRIRHGKGHVLLCGTCMDARGLTDGDLIEGVARSTMAELAELTAKADKVLVF